MAVSVFTAKGKAGNWSDALNWHGGVPPGTTDTALLSGSGDYTESGTFSVGNVMTLGTVALTIGGAINTYGTGFCTGFMVCDGASATFMPGSSLNDPNGALLTGVDAVGSFTANGSAAAPTNIHTANATIGKLDDGVGTVTIDHAVWSNQTVVFLGFYGAGTLNVINDGRVYIGGNLAMGMWAGGSGTVTLADGGDLTVGGAVSICGPGTGAAPGTGTLTVNAGSVFDVKNGASVIEGGRINLAGGAVSVGDTHVWLTIGAGAVAEGNGLLTTRAAGMLEDNGLVEAHGGNLRVDGVVVGSGTMQIDANSTLTLTGSHLMLPTLTFAGPGATLSLSNAEAVASKLNGFTFGDEIRMAGIDAAAWSSATDNLTLLSGGTTVDTLHLSGNYANDVFSVTQSSGIGVVTLHGGPGH